MKNKLREAGPLLGLSLILALAGSLLASKPLSDVVATSVVGPNLASACGEKLPIALSIPAGFSGPVEPAKSDVEAPNTEQLIRRWESANGSFEVRWPTDPQNRPSDAPMAPDDAVSLQTSGQAELAADGSASRLILLKVPGADLKCQAVQIRLTGKDLTTLENVAERFLAEPLTSSVPLVVGSENTDKVPAAAECSPPSGVPAPANQGSATVSGPASSAQAALTAFLEDKPTLLKRGYIALHLPDGSIAFGNRGVRSTGFVTVVHVVSGPTGWTVVRWDASGC